jgi:hypothetical protein
MHPYVWKNISDSVDMFVQYTVPYCNVTASKTAPTLRREDTLPRKRSDSKSPSKVGVQEHLHQRPQIVIVRDAGTFVWGRRYCILHLGELFPHRWSQTGGPDGSLFT